MYALLSPHLANCGDRNTGWVGDYKGVPMFFAERDETALALGVRRLEEDVGRLRRLLRWLAGSFQSFSNAVGVRSRRKRQYCLYRRNRSDGKQRRIRRGPGFRRHRRRGWPTVRSSLLEDHEELRQNYVLHWKEWQDTLIKLDEPHRELISIARPPRFCAPTSQRIFSAASSPAFRFPGDSTRAMKTSGVITSSGRAIWSRSAGGVAGSWSARDAVRVLRYLESTQEADGHWAQNMWLDGRPYWGGMQMDETALPILLVGFVAPRSSEALGGWTAGGQWCAAAELSSPQRSRHSAGSMGRGWRIFTIHSGSRDFSTARGSRSRRHRRSERFRRHSSREPTPGTIISSAGSTPPEAILPNN